MTVVGIIAALAAAYLIGSVSGARVLAGAFAAPDIRRLGSGNAGTSNAWRIGGRGYGAAVLGFDLLKGAVATGLAAALAPIMPWPAVAGFVAVVGHVWPVFHGFRGGKGLATAAGVLVFLAPVVLVTALAVFGATLWARRIVSLASLAALAVAGSFALLAAFMDGPVRALIGGLCVLLVVTHRENIVRLRLGQEPRIRR